MAGLTFQERFALRDIECHLILEDPRFAQRLERLWTLSAADPANRIRGAGRIQRGSQRAPAGSPPRRPRSRMVTQRPEKGKALGILMGIATLVALAVFGLLIALSSTVPRMSRPWNHSPSMGGAKVQPKAGAAVSDQARES